MFTGIVSELGVVEGVDAGSSGLHLRISAPATAAGCMIGDSVAVNGVCLTVVDHDADRFGVDVVAETVARSSISGLAPGDRVNLERPMPASGRFDGHIVQGHVDGVGTIVDIEDDAGSHRIRVAFDPKLARYVVHKGSVAIDGTSLTVAAVAEADDPSPWLEFVIIPHTLEVTTFGIRKVGDPVNLEVDVIAKYVERMVGTDA